MHTFVLLLRHVRCNEVVGAYGNGSVKMGGVPIGWVLMFSQRYCSRCQNTTVGECGHVSFNFPVYGLRFIAVRDADRSTEHRL